MDADSYYDGGPVWEGMSTPEDEQHITESSLRSVGAAFDDPEEL